MTATRTGAPAGPCTGSAPLDVADATRRWFTAWEPARLEVERIALLDAVGRVAAGPVRALIANPAQDVAAMDGIAVTAACVPAAGWLPSGGYDVVDTGDPLPPGRDTVIPSELLDHGPSGMVGLTGPLVPGKHVRWTGEDVSAGEVLLPAGHRLRPVDLAVLASAGYAEVEVLRRPRVTIVPTGDEIRPAGTLPQHGEIVDSNSVMIAATLTGRGVDVDRTAIVPDDPEQLATVVRAAAGRSDLILVIAGSSAGRDDHTAAVVRAVGGVLVHHLPLRPGHPVLLGTAGSTPLVGIPGYPVAAARVTGLFAGAALDRIEGAPSRPGPRVTAVLCVSLPSSEHTDEEVLVTLAHQGGRMLATPLPRGAGALTSLMRADGVVRMPIGCAGWTAGDEILVEARDGAPPHRRCG